MLKDRPSDFGIYLIEFYRKTTYPVYYWLDKKGINPFQCTRNPSCSHYTEQAIRKYGLIKGSAKGLVRIIRCGPSNHIIDDPLD